MSGLADNWPALAKAAAGILERKREHYPKFIASGAIGEEAARQDEEIWESIAADWRFASTLKGEPGSKVSRFAKRAALELALARAEIRREAGRERRTIAAEIAILETLLAWERRTLGHIWCAETSLALREAAEQTRKLAA